jgi:transposase
MDAAADGGGLAGVAHAGARLTVLPPGDRWRMAVGARAKATAAGFEQRWTGVRVWSTGWTVAATLGVDWSTE